MAKDEKNCLEQGQANAGLQPVSLDDEKERLLAEARELLDRLAQGGECDPDRSFRNFSFGLGIDPNG